MKDKRLNISVVSKPNAQITIIGKDRGAIAATEVESILDYTLEEARDIVTIAKNAGNYIPFMNNDDKIKSIIIMNSGKVYPSSFSVVTLKQRVLEATEEYKKEIKGEI